MSILHPTQSEYGTLGSLIHQLEITPCDDTLYRCSRVMQSADFGLPEGDLGTWYGIRKSTHPSQLGRHAGKCSI